MHVDPRDRPVIPDYELLKLVGRGSYGEVWLARSVTGVFRVIKVVRRSWFPNERPYQRELEGISRYQAAVSGRPRQLALLHVGRNDQAGYFYYVMEPADDAEAGSEIDPEHYVPLTLKELFSRRGRLPAAECVQIALELARGLAVLHGENLIHRDIKPSNVIFVQRVPKLADVGLVAASESTMTCVGTPGYVPPEGPGSVAGDVYSFGKLLYELTMGLDRSRFPLIPKELVQSPDAPLIRELNAVILRACHPDPAARHPSAEALARDLEVIQAGRSVAFYEQFRKRARAIALGAAAFGLISAAVAGALIWRSNVRERANQQTRLALYRSDLAIAQLAHTSGDLGRARAALQRQAPAPGEPDLRGLEWYILNHEVRGEGVPLEPATNRAAIHKLAVDPTGRWLAGFFEDDLAVGVWDLQTRRHLRTISNVRVLAGFTPDGRIAVDEPSRALRLESVDGSNVQRLETGERIKQLLPEGHLAVVSPEGDFILSIANLITGGQPHTFNCNRNLPDYTISHCEISQNRESLIYSAYREHGANRTRVLVSADLRRGEDIWQSEVPGRVLWVRCSPTSKIFAANVRGSTPSLYSTESPSELARLEGHTALVSDAAFNRTGQLIATASADQSVRVWSTTNGEQTAKLQGLGRPATAVCWSADGESLFAGDDQGAVRRFNFPARHEPTFVSNLHADAYGDVVFNQSGTLIAASQQTNEVALIRTADLERSSIAPGVFQPIKFSLDDALLYAFASDWSISTIEIPSGKIVDTHHLSSDDLAVLSWRLSPDGKKVALSTRHKGCLLVPVENPTQVQYLPETNSIWAIAFSPDSSELWTGTEEGHLRRWSVEGGRLLNDFAALDDNLNTLAISPDNRWVAVAYFNRPLVQVFDRANQVWLPPLTGHRRFVQALAFTEDSTRLITGGFDGRLILWRVPSFQELASFELPRNPVPSVDEGISNLTLAPRSLGVAALTEDGRLQFWRTR